MLTKRYIFIGAFFALFIGIFPSQNIDYRLLHTINAGNYPVWDNVMLGTSKSAYLTTPLSVVVCMGAAYYKHDEKQIRNSWKSAANILVAGGISSTLKFVVNRHRPFVTYPGNIIQRDKGVGPYSYPSGHSTLAFAMATNLCLSYQKWYITVPAYAYAGMVAYSRMRLGVHYPSDVLSGALIGIGSGFLVWYVDKWYVTKHKK